MELLDIMKNRRSVRTYTDEPISEIELDKIISAGLYSASGRHIRPWELIVIKNRDTLQKMSKCRTHGSLMLEQATAAIVVLANQELTDVWIEDCSIVMANMHLMADSLGVGSCWIQGRLRDAENMTTEKYLRELLKYPENYRLEAILSLGKPANHPKPNEITDDMKNKVHYEVF